MAGFAHERCPGSGKAPKEIVPDPLEPADNPDAQRAGICPECGATQHITVRGSLAVHNRLTFHLF